MRHIELEEALDQWNRDIHGKGLSEHDATTPETHLVLVRMIIFQGCFLKGYLKGHSRETQ